MLIPRPIHPFPARMAPEIALEHTMRLPRGSAVLDPMAGSGTVLRAASEEGHTVFGFDLDPLAVLITRAWTTPVSTEALLVEADSLVREARALDRSSVALPWIDDDPETTEFVNYWFAVKQQAELRRMSAVLRGKAEPVHDVLRTAFSRLIITKEPGASLARDTSHSRPHRVVQSTDFDVSSEFLRSVAWVAARLKDEPPRSGANMSLGDARWMAGIADESVDGVITSPPYLNAIDYMRAHRLTLVWFGYRMRDLRAVRGRVVGAERQLDEHTCESVARELTASLPSVKNLDSRTRGMVKRFAVDVWLIMNEIHRVLRVDGSAILVVGDSCLRGVFIQNSRLIKAAARRVGLTLIDSRERVLPDSRRYLPPPAKSGSGTGLERRMRSEVVLSFTK